MFKKSEKNEGWSWGENVDMVCAHISKYGNIDNHKVKIAVRYAKNEGWGWRAGVYMVCAHISKYGNIGNHKGKIAVKYAKKN